VAVVTDFQIVIRAIDRAPMAYLSSTVAGLHGQGIPKDRIHVFPTAPGTSWIDRLTRGRATVHEPARLYRATENMGIALGGAPACEWVIHLEDDARICRDFLGSVGRWIDAHVNDGVRLVSFFTPSIRRQMQLAAGQVSALSFPLDRWTSSVCVALRGPDAAAAGPWILATAPTWRVGPNFPSWATHRGADKMIAAWQRVAYPTVPNALASVPCLVQHVGRTSSLRRLGRFEFVQAPVFTGEPWGRS
jgi:hypothetical protein